MRSRWPVVAAVLGGLVVCLPLAVVALGVTAAFMYGRFGSEGSFLLAGFVVFTLLAVPVGLMLWPGGNLRRGFAVGLLLGWAGSGIWVGWTSTTEYLSTHGPATVVAFDALTGRPAWTIELDGANGASSPTVEAGLVFVQTGQSYDSTAGSLVALDAGTGQRLWDVATESASCGGAGFGAEPPVVADGVVVVRAAGGHVKGIHARAGRELWRAEVSGAPAAAAAGVVAIGSRTTYTGLDLTTGTQRWSRTLPEAAWGVPGPASAPW